MDAKSTSLENALLDHQFGGPAYTPPLTYYLALFTTVPTDAGGGVEVSGTNYARVAVLNDAGNFPAAVGGVKTLAGTHTFPVSGGDWGTVTAVGLLDAPAGGDLKYYGLIMSPQIIGVPGIIASFTGGMLTITEN